MHRGELLHPDVLEDAEHGQFAALVHERVVGDYREIKVHDQRPLLHPDRLDFVVLRRSR